MPPWVILGAVAVLFPVFLFMTLDSINRHRQITTQLLVEKGAALIRAFEAGTRTGMMGMMGMHRGDFQLQRLLTETAQQPDIVHLLITDPGGTVLAHNNPAEKGSRYGEDLDLARIAEDKDLHWRMKSDVHGRKFFEVFRRFSPVPGGPDRWRGGMMRDMWRRWGVDPERLQDLSVQIVFVGLDTTTVKAAQSEDLRHSAVMAFFLLLIAFAGIVSLFLAEAYRAARSSLTRVKALSDNVVKNMPMGLVTVDTDGKIASINQAAEHILQLAPGKNTHRHHEKMLPEALSQFIRDLTKHGGLMEREMECSVGEGDTGMHVPLEAIGTPLEAENGVQLGYMVLFRDLTQIQRLKEEMARSRRLAAVGRLAAGVAHEVRNPLSSIKGFATYFKERYGDIPEDQKTAEIMIQEVERLNRVISQLLEFAKPLTLRKEPVLMDTIIEDALKMVEGDATRKGVYIHFARNPEDLRVPIDPDRFKQVLLNLFLNALEATGKGGALEVRTSKTEDGRQAEIIIRDTGAIYGLAVRIEHWHLI